MPQLPLWVSRAKLYATPILSRGPKIKYFMVDRKSSHFCT